MVELSEEKYTDVLVEELQKGMLVVEDALNRLGNVVIAAGTVIQDTERAKKLLFIHKIERIRVKVQERETSLLQDTAVEKKQEETFIKRPLSQEMEDRIGLIKQQRMVSNVRDEVQQIQKKLQEDFGKILTGKIVENNEIKTSIKKTLEIFNNNMNVFQLIEKLKDFDDVTYAHSQNVTIISFALGKWLGLNKEQLEQLATGAMLLDIGKMQIPKNILNKKEPLTYDERLECQKHAIYSHDLIKDYDFISEPVKQIVLYHHERVDGSGYPMGLKGDKIPNLAKIVAIADIYNALTSERPYREKRSPFEAIRILETEHLETLDANFLYVFLTRIAHCFIGQRVKLNDNRIGEIVFISKHTIYRPIIKIEKTGEVLDLLQKENDHYEIIGFL